MMAAEVARHFSAKRIGRGRWKAICTAHPDRHASLAISEGQSGVLLKCMSNGCDIRTILDTSGLRMADLFYDSRQSTPKNILMHRRLELLDRQAMLASWLSSLETNRRNYWLAAERRIMREYWDTRFQLYAEEGKK